MRPALRSLLAPNPGPFTYKGTLTHILGTRRLGILDPGPDSPAHLAALLDAARGREISHIIVTHTHRDHTGAVAALKAATGAEIVGCAAHSAFRALENGEENPLEAGTDTAFRPDREMQHGEILEGDGWSLEAIATPGHTKNHLCFAWKDENILLSGDHVMGWSSTIVAPPDGNMAAYMASLSLLLERPEQRYLPAHGDALEDGPARVADLLRHREMREAQILAALEKGLQAISAITDSIYPELAPPLRRAAEYTVRAHLEKLQMEGI